MKKYLAIGAILVVLLLVCAVSAMAAENGVFGGMSWSLSDDGVLTLGDGVQSFSANVYSYTYWPWSDHLDEITSVVSRGSLTLNGSLTGLCFHAKNLVTVDLSNCNTSGVTSIEFMFQDCEKLKSIDLSGWDTSNIKAMGGAFDGCKSLETITIETWDTSSCTSLMYTFDECSKLTSLMDMGIESWDVSHVGSFNHAFYDCDQLTHLDLSGWDMSSCSMTMGMFRACSNLVSLDASGWDLSHVTSADWMFCGCSKLETLNMAGWQFNAVRDASDMLYGAYALKFLDLTGWNLSNVSRAADMTVMDTYSQYADLTEVVLGAVNPFQGQNGIFWQFGRIPSEKDGIAYTGKWIREDGAYGPYSSAQLASAYTGEMAGKWVWQKVPTDYTIEFVEPMETHTGSMSNVSTKAAEAYTLPANVYSVYGAEFKHWIDADGYTYADQGTIPANRYTVGETIQLTPVFDPWTYTLQYVAPSIEYGGDMGEVTVKVLEDYTLLENTYYRDGYAFDHWEDGNGNEYLDGGVIRANTYATNSTVVLTGVFTALNYTVKFVPPDDTFVGSMNQITVSALAGTDLPANAFAKFGCTFDHWDDGAGNTYENGGNIPANRYEAGSIVILTAVFNDRDTSVQMQNGMFEFSIYGDEKAFFDGIPAGTSYYVSEKVPEDWVLIMQSNSAGVIYPLEEAEALFVNKYQPGIAMAQFVGRKLMDEQPADADSFSFELWEGNVLLQTKSVMEGGFVMFDAIQYDKHDAGWHEYVIKEVAGDDETVLYDGHEEVVMVQVTAVAENNGTMKVTAEVTYDDDNVIFNNWTKPGVLVLRKVVDDLLTGHEGDEFRFRITFKQENGLPLEDTLTCTIEP